MSAEVRTDAGKWVKSTWRVQADGRSWWVVVGSGNVLVTVIDVGQQRRGREQGIVTGGHVYAHVDAVNAALMRDA